MEEVREIKGCGLIVHGCKAGKERNIALICEEMRIKKKQPTMLQQGLLIQFSLLLFSII